MLKKWLRFCFGWLFRRKPQPQTIVMDAATFHQKLNQLTQGLLFSSESDYPFETVDWDHLTDDQIQTAIRAAHPSGKGTEETSLEVVFNKQIQNRLRSGDPAEAAAARQYQELHDFFQSNTQLVRVWRCGRIEIGVYIIGTLADGQRVGLKTISIET